MNSETKHSLLLKKWKEDRPKYESFCYDGILSEIEWHNSNPKILFLLKESNAGFEKIVEYMPLGGYEPKSGNSKTIWRNINIWSYVTTEYWNGIVPLYEIALSRKEKSVNSISYVNVKKCAQNKPVSNNNDIVQYAIDDKEFLINQITFINPDVIICGGTINSLKQLFPLEAVCDNIYQSNNMLVIDFFHPSYRIGYLKSFKTLNSYLSNSRCGAVITILKQMISN